MNKTFYYHLFVLTFLLHWSPSATAQEMVLVVERCKMLDQNSPINNIWVDEENVKWVSNAQGLHKVLAIDLVQKVAIPGGTTSLLTIRGGNANIEWNTQEMSNVLGGATISSASYDLKTKSLWIGTQLEGAFQVGLNPLRVLQRFNVENKKLTSNQINDIFIHVNSTIWIATNDGMLSGNGDKWSLQERYLNFVGVDAWGQNMWILGDDFLWQVDSRGKWTPIAIELKNVEGKLRDIAVDDEGRVWIASNMMTGYDVAANRYQRFGPGQYFTSQYVNCLDVDQDGSIWTGTDDKGLYLIQWEAAMTINILMDTPLDCKNSQPTASLSTKITGGEAPYTYTWNSGQSTDKITNLAAGLYEVSVKDATGLVKTGKYEIPDPSISLSIEIVKPSSGSADGDASVNLLINGGTGAMTYRWDNGETKQLATRLTAGQHSVTVTDENGCSATTSFSVTEKVTPLAVVLNAEGEIKCADATNGVIKAVVTGGKAPIKYSWSQGSQNEGSIANLSPGEYAVTIADAAGQTASAFIKLTAPTPMVATVEVISPANLGVSDGQANIKVTGGKSPYTYKWGNGTTTALVKNLDSGEHTITVIDANGCALTQTVNVNEKIASLGVIIKVAGQINCAGQSTASLKLDISGGKGPYTYLWSDGQKNPIAENLKAGVYTVTVTDVVGTGFTASHTIAEPTQVTAVANVDAAASTNGSDGKATVKASGGSGTYTYAWDTGEAINKAVKLNPGTHVVTVTDAAGCSATASVVISENILELNTSIEQTGFVKCAGSDEGGVSLIVNGGKKPYTYSWNNGSQTATLDKLVDGLYTVTITDATGQTATTVVTIDSPKPITLVMKTDASATTNKQDGKATVTATGGTGKYTYAWDSGETIAKAVSLGAGKHSVTVTDENGCTAEGSIVITENILELNASIEQTGFVKCAGSAEGGVKLNVNGGKGPFTYAWSNGSQAETLDKLAEGIYTVTITDATGRTANSTVTIASPKLITLVMKADASATTNKQDGKATVTATGGTGKYTYAWDSGETIAKALSLGAGKHTVTVTDENGCTAEGSIVMTENILPLAANIEEKEKILCAGQTTASLTAIITGGKPPYSIKWKGPGKEYTGESISALAAGQYAMQVEDVSGSSATASFEIKAPQPLRLVVDDISPANTGVADGSLTLKVSGGTPPYTLEGATWPAGVVEHKLTKLKPGKFEYVIRDASGCTVEASATITEDILPLTVGINQTGKILCAGTSSAAVETIVKGGKPPYTYAWSNSSAGASLTNLAEGNYTLTVTDAIGQKAQAEIKVAAPAKLTVDAVNLRSATNDRIMDGKGGVDIKGGQGPFTYQWNSGETTAQASKLPLGQGSVTITDKNGCSASASFLIKQKELPELTEARLSSGEPIRMEKIQFDADSIVIRNDAKPSIDELYEFLYDNPTIIIEVSGHTNGLPADEYCDRISTQRADSVKDYLTGKGIESRRVIAIGHGKRKPIATNQTPEGRKRNQRVEIRLIKIEE